MLFETSTPSVAQSPCGSCNQAGDIIIGSKIKNKIRGNYMFISFKDSSVNTDHIVQVTKSKDVTRELQLEMAHGVGLIVWFLDNEKDRDEMFHKITNPNPLAALGLPVPPIMR